MSIFLQIHILLRNSMCESISLQNARCELKICLRIWTALIKDVCVCLWNVRWFFIFHSLYKRLVVIMPKFITECWVELYRISKSWNVSPSVHICSQGRTHSLNESLSMLLVLIRSSVLIHNLLNTHLTRILFSTIIIIIIFYQVRDRMFNQSSMYWPL